jgi:peptidoglycan/LPS O-acetylase OafA/YrhL
VGARPAERIESLTGLRFAAALGILLYHFGGPLVAGGPAWLQAIRAGGFVWVGLFYLLSGFVLARAHPAPLSPVERRRFWVVRFARLYPAYLLAFVLAAPFALERWRGGGAEGAGKAAVVAGAALLLVQAWAPPVARLWNAPGWSTSVVAAFYAAFPFLAARLSRLSRRGLALAAVGAWVVTLAFPLAWLALRPDGAHVESLSWNEPVWLAALKFHPLARAGEFVAGVALGLLHRRGLSLGRAGAVAAPAALLAVVALLAWDGAPYVLVHNGLALPLFAVALLGLAGGEGPLARALASRPLRLAGDASFALYALQEPLWQWSRALAGGGGEEASRGFVLAFAAAAIAVAVLVSRWLERPARRALRALLLGGERRGAAPAAGPVPPLVRGEREQA